MAKKTKQTKKVVKKRKRGRPPLSVTKLLDSSPITKDVDVDFNASVRTWRRQLSAELNKEAVRQGSLSPMMRIAKLFYSDDKQAVQILQHLLPRLKAIEARIEQENPFKLILDIDGSDDSDDEDEDNS